jgi:hypothetical protein
LRFKRGQNDLTIKQANIDNGGVAEFNEKIEMKTYIEWDAEKNEYKPKLAQLQAILSQDGTTLGSTELNLSDYAKPDRHLKSLLLRDTAPGVSAKSFITVEIRSYDASEAPKQKSQGARVGGLAAGHQRNAEHEQLAKRLAQVEQELAAQTSHNQRLREDLVRLGVSAEAQVGNALAAKLAQGMGASATAPGGAKDNSAKYKAMPGIDDGDLKQLLKLDKDLQRLFEVQMAKRNKNDEIVRNKISELNRKTVLREFLFKKVSYQ